MILKGLRGVRDRRVMKKVRKLEVIDIKSYESYVRNRKTYLKRKKFLNRKIKELTKLNKYREYCIYRYYKKQIELWNDDLERLNVMFIYYKFKNKMKLLRHTSKII